MLSREINIHMSHSVHSAVTTDGLVVCHLPHGPTASFSLSNTVMRHDLPEVGTMSEAFPHLIFHNFKTTLGLRVCVCVFVCVCV